MSQSAKYSPLHHYFISHIRAFLFGLGEIIRAPLASLLTLMVIGIAMALPTGFYVALNNAQTIAMHWHGDPTISLYLKQNAPTQDIANQLKNNPEIAHVVTITAKLGLQQFAKQANLDQALGTLKDNPLPDVLVITPKTAAQAPKALNQLAKSLGNLNSVDVVQLDKTWVKRLYYLISITSRLSYVLAILFAIGVVVIIGNTIRLTMQNHRQEIRVYRLLGASPRFIMRPLLYRGLLYGLLGGIIAWILVQSTFLLLQHPLQAFLHTYGNNLEHNSHSKIGLCVIIICGLLGYLGAYMAAKKYLSDELII